uniref:Protein kinase domain-containing protein n=1 Tax=Daucus carota subsp. sativus TaxID=79200 RepID=A0A175YGK7_DAUCS
MKNVWIWLLHCVVFLCITKSVKSDPQTNLLNQGCSQFISTDVPAFSGNRNLTFSELRRQLSNNTHFATAQQSGIYAMAQCRNYLSGADCLDCFDAAVSLTLNCSSDGGARVIYEGCFLRYEAHDFYSVATLQGNTGKCSTNLSRIEPNLIDPAVESLLKDLEVATPKTKGLFAAATKQVIGVTPGSTIYAYAQCAQTVSPGVCRDCLSVAYGNVQGCPPRAGGSSVDAGCFLRYSDTPFFPSNFTTDITPYVQEGGSSSKSTIILCVVGAVCFFLLILALLLWYRLYQKKAKRATKSFSEEYKIGEGGFGDVYKGIIKNGDVIAVKKLAMTTSKAKKDFESEIRLISNIHHKNIVRLLGCSGKGSDLLLVFEYMANGSLDKFLYGEKQGTLSWKQRLDIIFGVARGLAYLHDQFHIRIIHRDIKSSNILLDVDFQPKIADFGLARLIAGDQSHLSTRFAGTLGYTAPEYAFHGHLSEKVDTYGFGIVVLEIVSGRRSTNSKSDPVTGPLLEDAWKLYEDGMHSDLVDESMDPSEYNIEHVKKIIQLALMCTQSPTSIRPTMSEVVVLLTNDRSVEQRSLSKPTMV